MSSDQNTDSLRVLHGAYWFATATINLANEQAKRHRVMYITTQKAVHYAGDTEWKGLFDPQVRLRVEAFLNRKNPTYYIDRIKGLIQGLHSFGADVFHLQDAYDPVVYSVMQRLTRVPLVVTVHDPIPHLGEDERYVRYYEKRKNKIFALRRRADHIITLGSDVKEQLLRVQPELHPDKISVVLHIPMNHLLRWKSQSDVERPGTILFFGRINEYKGLSLLLESWQKIRRECPNSRLVVAGRGNDLPKYREQLLADERCELIEQFVPHNEMARLFVEASVIVLPYLEATQSGPLSAAITFGRPVIVTNVGGLPEMVDNNHSGFVVQPNNPEALADATIKLLNDDRLRQHMQSGARELGQTRLSPSTLAMQTEDVYRKAISTCKYGYSQSCQ